MAHVIESASSGRAKCRSCDQPIAKGELRFGERQPNAFGDGEMTLWFHLPCGAYSRPEPFLEAQSAAPPEARVEARVARSRRPVRHRRTAACRACTAPSARASGRAHCRSCRELIAKGDWRLSLVFFEEYRFNPGGYIHAQCSREYFETVELLDRIRHFTPELREPELTEVAAALAAPKPTQMSPAPE